MFQLYPFQQEIIDKLRKALKDGFKSPVVVSPTGSGKTIMFAYIAKGAMQKGKKVLILTHRREILSQTLKKLYAMGVQCGQIASDKPMTRDPIQVGMILTVNKRLNRIHKPDLIIGDEFHHFLQTNSFGNVIKKFHDVPITGWTATPERLSGEGLGINAHGFCDSMILGPSIAALVRDGYLSYPVMYRPPKEITEKFRIVRGEFDTDQQEKVMSQSFIVGNIVEHYKKYFNGLPAICFCVSIKHSKLMADSFNAAGFRTMAVYAGMPDKDREFAFQGLETGEIQILTNCQLIDEGVDIPNVAGVILAAKTASLARYLQRVGRALRKYSGKEHAIILDHTGNYYTHGHPLNDREWSLDAKKRTKKGEKPPTTTTCPKCFGIWPGEPRTCPSCGFSFADNPKVAGQQRKNPKQIEGELIAALPEGTGTDKIREFVEFIGRIQTYAPDKRRKAMIAKAYQTSDYKEIDALAHAIGYKEHWTSYIWKNVLKRGM